MDRTARVLEGGRQGGHGEPLLDVQSQSRRSSGSEAAVDANKVWSVRKTGTAESGGSGPAAFSQFQWIGPLGQTME